MPPMLLNTIPLLLLTVAAVSGLKSRHLLRGTTLLGVWWWVAIAGVLWSLAWIESCWMRILPGGYREQLWYSLAVMSVCPLIAVLGARRPVSRVWTSFVVLPLILVLQWPALANWSPEPGRLELQPTALIGFGLVLLMGIGNYFGTRFTLAMLMIAAAVVLILLPLGSAAWSDPSRRQEARWVGTILYSCGWIRAARRLRVPVADQPGLDWLWRDFRDLFGIVWARRILERVNQMGRHEAWTGRLDLDGFHWDTEPPDSAVLERAESTLRWLLRRFVDPDWIDERIGLAEPNRVAASPDHGSARGLDVSS